MSLWHSCVQWFQSRAENRRRPQRRWTPRFEQLEGRCVPAVSLTTTPGAAVVIGSGAKLTDSATLSGGSSPSGYILFTLTAPGGSMVDAEIIGVTGNGTYSTPNGYQPAALGSYQWTATYSGDGNNTAPAPVSGSETASAATTPALTTTPGGSVVLGSSGRLTDTATLTGGSSPTGTITFYLFAPGVTPNATDSNNAFTTTVTVHGNGTYKTPSSGYAPTGTGTLTGTYQWVVTYSGDSRNNAVSSTTGSEKVTAATPTITNTPGGAVTVGSSLTDSATLSGGFSPGGSILFTLTAANGTIVYTKVVTVTSGTGTTGYAPTAPGIYQWTASYSGDANNNPVTSSHRSVAAISGTANTPTLTPKAGGTAVVGSGAALTASVALAGGSSPTGTITFYLFAPGTIANPTGSGSIFSSTATVNGNGTYSSASGKSTGSALPTKGGRYQWLAVYSGDANNNSVSSAAVAESAVVKTPPAGSRFGRT